MNPHVVPFISVENGEVNDSNWSKKYIRTMKALIGNQIRHYINQLDVVGLLPLNIKWITSVVT